MALSAISAKIVQLEIEWLLGQANFMSDNDQDIHPGASVAPGYLANHAARVFNRLIDDALRPYGMSLALIGPIMLISWKGPMLQRDLVQASAIKQPAMVALLDKLEAMRLIERRPMPDDRRAAMVHLTAAGLDIAARGGRALVETNTFGLRDFTAGEAKSITVLLQRFIDNLNGDTGTKHQE